MYAKTYHMCQSVQVLASLLQNKRTEGIMCPYSTFLRLTARNQVRTRAEFCTHLPLTRKEAGLITHFSYTL